MIYCARSISHDAVRGFTTVYDNCDDVEIMEYVLVFPRTADSTEKILLVEKDRPAWQKGRLNLVGGKVEQGETAVDAAVRELAEESGMGVIGHPCHVGTIEGTNCVVYVVQVLLAENQKITPRPEETERVFWEYWAEVKNDPRLITNLKTIIPLCMAGLTGWIVRDENSEPGSGMYTIEVSF